MAYLLLTVHGTVGDVSPMLRLGRGLKERGHRVTLITHAVYAEMVQRADLDFAALDTLAEFELYLQDMSRLNEPQGQIAFFQQQTLPRIPREYTLIQEYYQRRANGEPVVLIANHLSGLAAQMAAEQFGLPLARVFIAPAHAKDIPFLEQVCRDFLAGEINDLRAQAGLPPVSDWAAWVRSPAQNLGVWPEWFAPDPSWPVKVSPVGFLLSAETAAGSVPDELSALLASGRTVLITGGTGRFLKPEFYTSTLAACLQLGLRAAIVTTRRELLPDPLPEGVKCFSNVPFGKLMPQVVAVIHHGGIGTLAQAIAAGVPQLALASGTDRPDTSARLEQLGIGMYLPPTQWQADHVSAALSQLVDSPTTRLRCRVLAERLLAERPGEMVSELIEALAKPGYAAASVTLPEVNQSDVKPPQADLLRRTEQLSAQQQALLVRRLKPRRDSASERNETKPRLNILLTTHGTEGDIVPFVRIGRALKAHNHQVTLLTHCTFEALARQAGLDFVALDTPEEFRHFVEDVPLLSALPTVPQFFRKHILPKLILEYERISERIQPGKTILISRATPGVAARMVAEKFGVPQVTAFMAPSHIATLQFIEQALGHFLGEAINDIRSQIGLLPVQDWSRWWQSSTHRLGFWPDWFCPPGPGWPAAIDLVGFLALHGERVAQALPPAAQEFLESGPPPILITRGTSVAEGPEFFTVSVEACRRLGYRALVVTPHERLVPTALAPQNARWFKRLPFIELMPQVAAVIHHGGLGSLSQALAAGLPQLALTDSSERTDNASRLSRLGVGRALPQARWLPAEVTEALQELILDPLIPPACQHLAHRIAEADPAGKVCEVIERLVLNEASPTAAEQVIPIQEPQAPVQPNAELIRSVEQLSPQQQALLLRRLNKKRAAKTVPEIQAFSLERGESDSFPLSFGQQRLWFLDQLEPGRALYNEPFVVRLSGRIDSAALQASLRELVRRQAILRTIFLTKDGQPRQTWLSPEIFTLSTVDLSELPQAEGEIEARRLARAEAQRPFDLACGPLLRVRLFEWGDDEHLLLVILHHIVADHWSIAILIKELGELYEAFSQGRDSPLPELPIQYVDFAVWQRQWLAPQGTVLDQQVAYWRQHLAGAAPVLELPTDYPRSAIQSTRGARLALQLSRDLTEALKALSQREGVTLFMLLLAAFQILLHRYTGQVDISIGTPVAGRQRAETANLIGFFLNTLVLRIQPMGGMRFREFLQHVREVCLGAYAHQDLPFEKLVEELQPERSLRHAPLFQVAFGLQNIPMPTLELAGLKLGSLESIEIGIAKTDVDLYLEEIEAGLIAVLNYNADLFAPETAQRLLEHFQVLLEGIVADPTERLADLPLLTKSERQQVLVEWNITQAPYPERHCLHHLVEAQVARTPDAIALVYQGQALTYQALNARANQLAHYLQTQGVGPEVVVGVCLERSVEAVVALLGILKAGGAYVPLDPAYPEERLAFMVADARIEVLVTQERLLAAGRWSLVEGEKPQVIVCLDSDWKTITNNQQPATNNQPPATSHQRPVPENLAYVLYTSGSTGRPKGVALTHRGAVALVTWAGGLYSLDELNGVLASTSLNFDLSIFELFVPFAWGGRVVLVENALALAEEPELVSLINTVPSAIVELLRLKAISDSVRTVNLAGEALTAPQVAAVYSSTAAQRVVNLYGPTEDTTYSTFAVLSRDMQTLPPIGRPLANTQAYILDPQLQPTPIGVAGELYLSGVGLARGYLNQPALTAERFIPNPFAWMQEKAPGSRVKAQGEESLSLEPYALRLYRTGDLARYLPDGNIEYLGRLDHQVKLRGFRIELKEIEAVLQTHAAIQECVVLALEARVGTGTSLAAYVVLKAGQTAAVTELREYLQTQLPAYMLPTAFIFLERLPLTPNGKVNRQALPAPEAEMPVSGQQFVAPRTPREHRLTEIWVEVLGAQRVGVEDNFFELGGHSLLATQVISRIRQVFHVEVPLRQLFETPTIAGLARAIRQPHPVALGLGSSPRGEAGQSGPAFLSYGQQRLWFLDQLEPGSAVYNIPAAVRLTGALDVAALKASLNTVVQRHDALRATFQSNAGELTQVIAPVLQLGIRIEDLSGFPESERWAQVVNRIREQTQTPFDLAHGPLIRVWLIRESESEHVLVLVLHHIVSDGWSLGVLIREVASLYSAQVQKRDSASALSTVAGLPDLPVQYGDYAAWQRERLEGEGLLGTQLAYWQKRLADVPVLQLPTDRPRPAAQTYQGARVNINLPEELSHQVNGLAQREGATPFMVLMAAFQALLGRHSGQVDFGVGTPVANRTWAEIEGLIGFFVNTLVLRAHLSGDPSFRELVKRVREAALGAYAHQDVPFERVVEFLQPERNLSHTPLFQVMFVLQNAPLPPLELPGLQLELMEVPADTAKYDLTLTLWEAPQGWYGTLDYNTDLFNEATIKGLQRHFETLLAGAVANPDCKLSALPLLTDAERTQIIDLGRVTQTAPMGHVCLHERVEAQADRRPEAIAVVYEDQHLSYGELNRRANQLAHYLRYLGVGPEARVGLYLERSVEMLVAILGVHKAGGAYLPLDLAYPAERLAFMLEDSQARVLLTQSHLLKTPKSQIPNPKPLSTICLDTDWSTITQSAIPKGLSVSNPQSSISPDNLAYVIYTSGSTGQPKGVLVSHANVARLFEATEAGYGFKAEDVWTLFHSYAFDFSVWEIWGAWLYGGRLVVVPYWVSRSPEKFYDLLVAEGVTILNQTPSAFNQLIQVEALRGAGEPLSLHRVIFGGEALELQSLQPWLDRHGDSAPQLINMYGITETTVHVTYRPLLEQDIRTAGGSVIGHPIPDLAVYILDEHLQPMPIGVPGEIYVGGAGVARGYLGRPELTAEKFVPNPFVEIKDEGPLRETKDEGKDVRPPSPVLRPSSRLYRTGDLARWRADGGLEYFGRMDDQVKIRGYRIELGEIESVLNAHPNVQAGRVLVREDAPGERRLVGYVVPSLTGAPSVEALRTFLRMRLPEYMLPAAFVFLEAFPLTPNGKLNRKALPAPDSARPPGANYVAPRTETEQRLTEIWAQVLKVTQVSVEDNFFELGGHSLLATQVVNRIRQSFQIELPLRSLFEAPTPAELARRIDQAEQRAYQRLATMDPRPQKGERLLSYGQQRLWFLDQLEPGSAAYNVPAAVWLKGTLDIAALAASLNEVVRRHAALRTTFHATQGQPYQIISPNLDLQLQLEDLRELPVETRAVEIQARAHSDYNLPFNLKQGPLLRTRLLRTSDSEYVLVLVLHHIISDAWSLGVLIREVATLYSAQVQGQVSILPELAMQYADYVAWQREWLEVEGALEAQLKYWQERLAGVPRLELPSDRPRPAVQNYRGGTLRVQWAQELSNRVSELAQRMGVTPFMVLLAGFQALLHRYTGQVDIAVGTPVANRTRAEIEALIGFFVNTLVLRTDLAGDPSFRDLVERVREVCLGAYAHQDAPFEQVVEVLQPERSLSHTPLFQVMFVLQNAPLPPLELPGLRLELMESGTGTIKFDLTLTLAETPQGLVGTVDYNTALFNQVTIERLIAHFERLLTSALADPDCWLSALPLLTDDEQTQIVDDWNATQAVYPAEASLPVLLEAQAAQTPEAVAVVFEDQHLTYGELNRRAKQLADYLQELGAGPESLVGLSVERSVALIVGLVGILKTGGAYVPLDPDYPAERLAFMLTDARIEVLVTQSWWLVAGRWSLATETNHRLPMTICLDTDWETIANHQPPNANNQLPATSPQPLAPDSLAYVIYTSGSTGRPKGAMNTQRGIVNRLWWMQTAYQLEASDRVLQKTPASFDVSVWEFFWPLMTGACLVVAQPEGHKDPRYLAELIAEQAVTTLHFVPAMLRIFLEQVRPGEQFPSVRRVISSGEALTAELVERFYKTTKDEGPKTNDQGTTLNSSQIPGAKQRGQNPNSTTRATNNQQPATSDQQPVPELHNLYGPTEAAVDVTSWACAPADKLNVPIGRPIANVQIYILDKYLQPVPVGVVGELHIGGVALGRGYWQRPELTAEKFVPNPFVKTYDEGPLRGTDDEAEGIRPSSSVLRLYKTGDLARYLPDGAIEYLGRMDHQVKVRGFRIELGEIEVALAEHLGVEAAVVMARTDIPGDPRLAAYVIARGKPGPTPVELREWLSQRLPEHMLPSVYVFLPVFPLTPNGKVDRRALPAPEADNSKLGIEYIAPRTPTEKLLAEIWGEVLPVQVVGVHDNFFEQGGHSLLATQVIARIYHAFGVELPLRSIFETPTVADLAQAVERSRGAGTGGRVSPLLPVPRDQVLLPASAQERIWFFDQLAPGDAGQNIAIALRVQGALHLGTLQQAFNEIVRRHETLRMAFVTVDGRPVLALESVLSLSIPSIDLCSLTEIGREAEARRLAREETQRGFDLTQAPLLRVTAVQLAQNDHRVLITIHHIVSDGWSLQVMAEEFFALYAAFSRKEPSPLPELLIQYADYAAWQRQSSQGGVLAEQLAYWRNQLRGELPVLKLPTDRPRPAVMGAGGPLRSWKLSAAETQALKAFGNQEHVTSFMLLLAAFQTLLHRYSAQTDIIVGSPVAGRVRVETERLIGCFINSLPLRSNLSGNPTFRELLQRVREVTLGAYAHQELPLEVIAQTIKVQWQLSHMPLFQTLFVMQNFPTQTLNAGDLQFEVMEVEIQAAGFDLTFIAWESGLELHGLLGYRADLFETATIDRMLIHFRTLLLEAVAHPDQRLSQLSLMPEAEKQLVLETWNATQREWPAWRPFHQLVEGWVAEQPEAVALVWPGKQAEDDQHITYGELNRRASQLAHYLRSLGVGPEMRVGICLERSPELVVALLGVLKAGGAYVPCDPSIGLERLAYLLKDSQTTVLLTQSHLLNGAGGWGLGTGVSVICLDTDWELMISSQSPTPRRSPKRSSKTLSEANGEGDSPQPPAPDSLAYLIYTSGSTGQPKGVMVSQANIVNAYRAWELAYGLRTNVRSHLQMANFSFDVFTGDVLRALGSGAKLVLCPAEWLLEPEQLYGVMQRQAVECAEFVPAVLRTFMEYLERNGKSLDCMRLLIVGSDVWPVRDHQALPRLGSETMRSLNSYGVTEATIDSAFFEGSVMGLAAESVTPIGRPLANVQVYVLDDQLQPTPVNVPGELYIGGQGVTRGYWGRPELTAERFVPNPFAGMRAKAQGQRTGRQDSLPVGLAPWAPALSAAEGLRLYRTGDRARWRADGFLEFLGRADEQVKLRGYRIEPGEIEAVLAGHPTVKECAILAREYPPGDKRLVAYVVPAALTEGVPLQLTCEMEFEDGHRETSLTETLVLGEECELIVAGTWMSGLILRLHLPHVGNGSGLTGQVIGQENERTRLRLSLSPAEQAILQRVLLTLPATNARLSRNLREYLKGKLPSYMLPSAISLLDKLPRTPSGKVDRQALPAPTSLSIEKIQSDIAPRTPREEKVAGIWAEVLQLERVGVEDNFFEMGGHSLLATQVISRVRDAFGVEVPLLELFAEPTVAGLAAAVERAEAVGRISQAPAIVPVARKSRRVKLSPRGELTSLKAPPTDKAE